jgi:hypothetical protein
LGIALRGRSLPKYLYAKWRISRHRRGRRRNLRIRDDMIGRVEEPHFEEPEVRRQ